MVDVPGPWLAVLLRPQVGGELAEVVQVRAHRMRGCVALTFQVPAEGRDGSLHEPRAWSAGSGRRAVPASGSAARNRSSDSRARADRARRLRALSRMR